MLHFSALRSSVYDTVWWKVRRVHSYLNEPCLVYMPLYLCLIFTRGPSLRAGDIIIPRTFVITWLTPGIECFLRSCQFLRRSGISQPFMEPSSSPHDHQISPVDPIPNESCYFHNLRTGLFLKVFRTEILCRIITSPACYIYRLTHHNRRIQIKNILI
jgi:hypothetical protein